MNQLVTEPHQKAEPKCSYFGTCGGCSYQDVHYHLQLELKRKKVEEIIGSEIFVNPVIPSPKSYHYRHIMALTVKKRQGALQLGFVGHDWHTFVPVKDCSIANEQISAFIPEALKKLEAMPEKKKYHTSQIVLRKGSEGEVLTSLACDRGKDLECVVLGKTFSYSMSSFFQNNFSILGDFIKTIRGLLNSNGGTLFDLYSGVGLLGLSLSDSYERIIGIEEGYEAIQHSKKNTARNQIQNAEYIEGKVEILLPDLMSKAQNPLHIIVDPPRSGLKPEVLECLTKLQPEKLLYISCHLEALKRDLEILTQAFRIIEVQPMDFFPQTKHVETLVLLQPQV